MAVADLTKNRKQTEALGFIPGTPVINIGNPDKFLNDLKLSPFWKVERDRDGAFVATARSVTPEDGFERKGRGFLFELMARVDPKFADKYFLQNGSLGGADYSDSRTFQKGPSPFSSFAIKIMFRRPTDTKVTFAKRGSNASLSVYGGGWGDTIDPNSFSRLACKLSDTREIYLLLYEQGSDTTRASTFQELGTAMREIKRIAELPEDYFVEDVYKQCFGLLFKTPLKDHDLRRFPGTQDRDTFYGYFRAQPGVSYEGIYIKISHPIYCPNEGTRMSSRIEKAEYVGKPYHSSDVMFFMIEDNAVYLSYEYDKQFGIFSGTSTFDGTLEILNDQSAVLLKTTEKFKGWER
jgi:hypothetical protein